MDGKAQGTTLGCERGEWVALAGNKGRFAQPTIRFPIFGINDNMLVVVWGLGIHEPSCGLPRHLDQVQRVDTLSAMRITLFVGLFFLVMAAIFGTAARWDYVRAQRQLTPVVKT